MKSSVPPGLAALAAVACCLLLPVLASTAGLAAIIAWGGLGVVVAALLVAAVTWVRPRLTKRADSAEDDCCAPVMKAEKR